MTIRHWTVTEDRIVREHYATRGAEYCATLLPGRSIGAIQQHAYAVGIRSQVRNKRRRWENSEAIDEAIRRVYQSTPKSNQVNELAKRLRRPRWWVSKRARCLGLVTPRFKEPVWTDAEIDLIEAHAHKSLAVIQRILKKQGYQRTETAICLKLKRLGTDTHDPDHYTACQLATMMGVDSRTVTGWIHKYDLPAKRRGTKRTQEQGGDMWWISRRTLRRWIGQNAHAVDLRKVDKYWFIDLMVTP